MRKIGFVAVVTIFLLFVFPLADVVAGELGKNGLNAGMDFLWIAIIILAAKLSNLVERFGQPAVLGELLVGIILGNMALAGFNFFEPIRQDVVIRFLAEIGVVILLFQVGLESNIRRMLKVGPQAVLVAIVGVVAPFLLGTVVVGPLLLPELSFNAHLFVGAILTATSVGVTARVFHDLGRLKIPEAQIILGAAVIDDVIGLTILAVVKAMVESGRVSLINIGWITAKAVLFLGGAIFLGQLLAPRLGRFFSKINPGIGMKLILAVSFGLIFAYVAELIGLAAIVGAFAAGLVLEPVHFRHFDDPSVVSDINESIKQASPEVRRNVSNVLESLAGNHIKELIQPLGYFLVPIFFVLTGMEVRIETLFNVRILILALAISVVAFGGKLISGCAAGRVRKWIIGWGMVPRCEVGLIFAAMGKALGVFPDDIFSMMVIVIMFTTILPPPILNALLKRQDPALDAPV
ncbi:MAG: cation:proton antiporter [Desulfobacteraceae bacterium]|nr:cation:proton antiporter [Desulfobacteraceae bacterium]